MKRVLIGFLSLTLLVALVGCGSGGSSSTISANSMVAAPEKKTGKPNNLASADAVPAPPGVKTGTPGG